MPKAHTHNPPKRVRFAGRVWLVSGWSYKGSNEIAYYLLRYDDEMLPIKRYVLSTEVEIVEQ